MTIIFTMTGYVIWDKGKPVAASDSREARRLEGRMGIIDQVLKEMGYSEGAAKYQEYVQEMMKDFKGKYTPFLERVDELAKKQGV